MAHIRRATPAEVPGLAARRAAAELLDGVLQRNRPLDEQLNGPDGERLLGPLDDRDRALVRKLVGTVLRRLGSLRALIAAALHQGLPGDESRLEPILLIGAAQILWLDIPDHAAVDLAVRLAQADRRSAPYAGLANAVLRRIAREGQAMLAGLDPIALDTPDWLMARWSVAYGVPAARAIAAMHAVEPPLDFTVKADPAIWAARLRGRVLPTATVRTLNEGRVSRLPGFAEGAWWIQDAAAALPVLLLGDVSGRRVADLCAAPGGKAAQLIARGARVTAVDRSAPRIARLKENLARLGMEADVVLADAAEWQGGGFDAVVVDPPCLSTGTIRRHPDIAWLKRETDLASLVALQRRLLDQAVTLLKSGATLIYSTCSLESEENEQQTLSLLERYSGLRRCPIAAEEIAGLKDLITPVGDLRTLPCQLEDPDPRMGGLDGFYAARLKKE